MSGTMNSVMPAPSCHSSNASNTTSRGRSHHHHTGGRVHALHRQLHLARQALATCLHQMPVSDKQAYLQALSNCPQLVQEESNPMHMLRSCKYQPRVAAKKLVTYWQVRCLVMGEQAFQPLATLNNDVRSGIDWLPNDRRGRPVLCGDLGQLACLFQKKQSHDNSAALKQAFLILNQVSQSTMICQTEGIVWLHRAPVTSSKHSATKLGRALACLEACFCLRLHSVHMASIVAPSERTEWVEQALPSVVSALSPYASRVRMHVVARPDGLLERLLDFDLLKEGIPVEFGGSWKPQRRKPAVTMWEDALDTSSKRVFHSLEPNEAKCTKKRRLSDLEQGGMECEKHRRGSPPAA